MDLHYGDKFLTNTSITYFAALDADVLIYTDSSGAEYRFEQAVDVNWIRHDLHQDTCEGQLRSIIHNTDYHLNRFSSPNNTAIAYAQIASFLDEETNFEENRIVDILKLSVVDDNTHPGLLSRICSITDDRNGGIDMGVYNDEQFIVHDSLSFLQKTFYNVYEQKLGFPKLYYTPTDGIVSFTNNEGVTLVIDRYE